jgi:uncharacterized repeat protein (TIGR03803 family)
MNRFDFGRGVLCVGVAAVLLVGCGRGLVSPTAALGGAFQSSSIAERTVRDTAQEKVIFTFGGDGGRDPFAPPIADKGGALYGTTAFGGGVGGGAVFKLTRSGSTYTETTLWNFKGDPDGAESHAALIANTSGALYGTTRLGGGQQNFGAVFKLTPSGKTYTESVIYAFTAGSDGFWPLGALIADKSGALYGTTSQGGGGTYGTVFKLTGSGTTYSETTLHSFAGVADGATPAAALLAGKHGVLYGTTYAGGTAGSGTVFKLKPSGKSYTESILYSFKGGTSDGAQPSSTLVADKSGALYGTTGAGGSSNDGTVFKLVPSGKKYNESVIYSFQGGADGVGPYAGLTAGKAGVFYGTTLSGGRGGGIVFKLTPSGSGYTESIVYTFQGNNDGSRPYAGLMLDASGALYGTTWQGGSSGYGTAFKVTP